jgi:hypothetical protein
LCDQDFPCFVFWILASVVGIVKTMREKTIGACIAVSLFLLSGCALRRPQAQASAPGYPPVAESSVQFLMQKPQGRFIKIGTIAVQQDASAPIEPVYRNVRESATRGGADIVVQLGDHRRHAINGKFQPINLRLISFLLLRRY